MAYLSSRRDRLRAELLARAARIAPDAPEAPENVLVKVPHGALVASIALSGTAIIGTLLTAGLLVIGVGLEQPGVLIPLLPIMLAFGGATFSHGSRLHPRRVAGRAAAAAWTARAPQPAVPPGRVQAIRLVQPLWRTRGWVRIDVNVAGYSGGRVGEEARP
jgi:putative membrane protein